MLFIAMLAFQLAGALLLLLNCSLGSKKAVIKNCFPGSNFIERDDDNNCTIPKSKLQTSAHTIYLNIVAFADLVIGYVLASLCPVSDFKTYITVISVIMFTIVLLAIEYFGSKFVVKCIYAKDMVVPYSELDDVDTLPTIKEIDDMFNDTFKE